MSLLTVVGIMGVAFAFSMYLETQATRQFVSTTQARYLAEAGVNVARALLDEDRLASRVDDATEPWVTAFQGSDVDVDGDDAPDAEWRPVADASQQTVGRYAVLVADESGKANLNAGQADPSPLGLGALNLTTLLQETGISDAAAVAEAIEAYRNGEDARPGVSGVDDDGDGAIDEPDEYQPLAPQGDDRRLESLEDLAAIAGLDAEDIRRLARAATVYSWDLNAAVTGAARINVNTATAEELLEVLFEAGVADPWQAAVNMADYVDADLELSKVTKSAQTLVISSQGSLGSWEWSDEPEGHYASDGPGGQPLSWVLPVPSGTFRIRALGVGGVKVGDVTVAGELYPSADADELLGTLTLTGTLTVQVDNREPAGTACAFRGVELSSESSGSAGVTVAGIEAVRFNEVMVEPTKTLEASAATFDAQGSDWACLGEGVCTNSGVGQARWVWTDPTLEPGRYHLRVFGSAAGQTVGEVRVEGDSELLLHEQRHPSTILVGSDGKITLTIGKTASDGTYYLKSVSVSLQPDAEYVELINLSDQDIDVGGWTIAGELTGGRQARLPDGTMIAAHGLLVAAVDLDDAPAGLGGNGISAREAWDIADDASAVQLEFPDGSPSADDDWLKAALAAGGVTRLTLQDGTATVDEVEYALPPPTTADFQSLEKGDPSVRTDGDGDGVDDEWYPSLQLYTPGLPNDNNGLKELIELEVIVHDPAEEITVVNRPLGGVGELAGLPSGEAWEPFASADLARLVDRLTVEGLRLEAEGRLVAGEDAWQEKAEGYYEHSSPAQPAVPGRWRWPGLLDGQYRLSLHGWGGEQMAVRWEQADGTLTDWSPALTANAQGRLIVGQVTVGAAGAGPSANALAVEVECASPSGICHLDYIRLDPQLVRIGPVNVNTAPLEVLRALPEMTDALISRLIAGRPYGDQDEKGRGIGDLLLGEVFGDDEEAKLEVFRRVAHLLTTRSDVFQVQSVGQAMDDDRPGAAQRILTVVQR
ncbi:MAG: general secretion pathway protein GspK [Candidatus Omnitrophica bacterium]|nr:general secretion pathway protein GspK [Candidatus Omnitrophota bacterium]